MNPTQKDENGIIHIYRVSVCIIDFRGDRSYGIHINPMEAKILKEKDNRVQFQFNGMSKRTIMKKALAKNEFGEVFGFNPYGIGTSLSCYKDEIDITIDLCIKDMWTKLPLERIFLVGYLILKTNVQAFRINMKNVSP